MEKMIIIVILIFNDYSLILATKQSLNTAFTSSHTYYSLCLLYTHLQANVMQVPLRIWWRVDVGWFTLTITTHFSWFASINYTAICGVFSGSWIHYLCCFVAQTQLHSTPRLFLVNITYTKSEVFPNNGWGSVYETSSSPSAVPDFWFLLSFCLLT